MHGTLNYFVSKALLTQADAHHDIIRVLKERIQYQTEEIEEKGAQLSVLRGFFLDHHPELIPEFVNLAYAEHEDIAKQAVSVFHDETLDLSTLPCTGSDFKPWRTA